MAQSVRLVSSLVKRVVVSPRLTAVLTLSKNPPNHGVACFLPFIFGQPAEQAVSIQNAGPGAGDGSVGIEGSGLRSTGASQHATGTLMSGAATQTLIYYVA